MIRTKFPVALTFTVLFDQQERQKRHEDACYGDPWFPGGPLNFEECAKCSPPLPEADQA